MAAVAMWRQEGWLVVWRQQLQGETAEEETAEEETTEEETAEEETGEEERGEVTQLAP